MKRSCIRMWLLLCNCRAYENLIFLELFLRVNMKVYKLFAEKMWLYFNSFPLEKVGMNVDNILGKIYFLYVESEVKRMVAFAGNNVFNPLPVVAQHNGKKTFSAHLSNSFKTSKSQNENIIVRELRECKRFKYK